MKKIILVSAALFFFASSAWADKIILKSGKEIEGKIVSQTDKSVTIDIMDVQITYLANEVEKIEEEGVAEVTPQAQAEVKKEAPPKPVPPVAPQTQPSNIPEKISLKTETPAGQASITVEPKKAHLRIEGKESILDIKTKPLTPKQQQRAAAAAAVFAGVFILALFLGVVFYIYSSACLFLIAKKTNHGPLWMAWVPVANLILMCKIAGLPYYWLAAFLLGLIPFVGGLLVLAVSAYFWYKIALVRNKPGWVGILCLIPLVNLIIMGYLAFSD